MPELLVIGVVVLVLYFLVRGGSRLFASLSGRRYRAYRQLAFRYRGRYENRGFSDPPTVSFAYNGSNVRVGLAPLVPGQTHGPRTRVVSRFSKGLPFRMELAPVARALPPQPPRGTRPVRCGDDAFDRFFQIQANDVEMARDFLSPSVRWSIANLAAYGPAGGMLLSINPERMLVQIDRNLGQNIESLNGAVRESLMILDGLIEGVAKRLSEGVEIVSTGAPTLEDAGPPICKVCGDLIQPGPRVICGSCNVPYHRDCWEFIGGCSVFGCSGKVGVPA